MRAGICEICGRRAARYVCQECGRKVCETCLEPSTWTCFNCYERLKREVPTPGKESPRIVLWPTTFKVFLLGFLLIFVGMVFMMVASVFSGVSTVGTVIFIGPIPIILGAGPYSHWAIFFAIILTILGAILFLTLRKQKT